MGYVRLMLGHVLGYVRLILGHVEQSWAHLGLHMGYVRLILGHLLGQLCGTNVCTQHFGVVLGLLWPKMAPNGPS